MQVAHHQAVQPDIETLSGGRAAWADHAEAVDEGALDGVLSPGPYPEA